MVPIFVSVLVPLVHSSYNEPCDSRKSQVVTNYHPARATGKGPYSETNRESGHHIVMISPSWTNLHNFNVPGIHIKLKNLVAGLALGLCQIDSVNRIDL